MGYKDILLVADGTPACAERTRAALALAGQSGAHVAGLLVRTVPQIPTFVAAEIPPDVTAAQREAADAATAEARQAFETAAQAAGASGEWRQAVGAVDTIANLHARTPT